MKKPYLLLIALLVIAGGAALYMMFGRSEVETTQNTNTVTANTALNENTNTAEPIAEGTCPGQPTPAQTEGPYYKTGSPEKKVFREETTNGTPITLTGFVYNLDCEPLEGVWLDFWQADGDGEYDNVGYDLRGHQETDADGHYTLETVIPGEYPGRTPHIHVKVRVGDGPILTTQIYFPANATENASDSIFDEALLATMSADGKTANFHFAVNE